MLFQLDRSLPMPAPDAQLAARAGGDVFGGPFPAHVYPPAGATLFEVSPPGVIALAAVAGSLVAPPSLVMRVPAERIAVVRSFSLFVDNMSAATDVRFTLRADGIPVTGLTQLRMAGRAAAWLERVIDDRPWVSPRGVMLDWEIVNVDGGAYNVSVSYAGWHFDPSTLPQGR